MIFKRFEWRLFVRVLFLLGTLTALSYFIVRKEFYFIIAIAPLLVYQLYDLYNVQLKILQEFNYFLEAIRYKDFSRHFADTKTSYFSGEIRKGFNEINAMLKAIAKEKETQHLYLQNILELVGTGIISYEEVSGEVLWCNDAFKKMVNVPFLKSLEALSKKQSILQKEVISLSSGESKVTELQTDKSPIKIFISATAFQIEGRKFKLVAFQNVNEVLEETETNAWQKLLRVLTHEIMNSIAPISSLADTLKNRLKNFDPQDFEESKEDLELGIETIKRRSEGLLKFADTYRSLNKISQPNLKKISMVYLFQNIHPLMQPTFSQKNIEFEIIIKDPNIDFLADSSLVEQVLINLLLNAMDAVKDFNNARIVLSGYNTGNGKTIIKIADNGPGIPQDLLDQIFIPFFSTKKTGSGIGLTLCKQIMKLHRGQIYVLTKENEGSVFVLEFPETK